MYSRGIPVVQAKIRNGYKVYNLAIGDTVTDMVVRWSYPENDQTLTGEIAGMSLAPKGNPENHGAAVLDNIAAFPNELDACAMINDAQVYYEVDAILLKVEETVDGAEEPVVKYIRIPVDRIYSFSEEPDETILEVLSVNVVDGDDGMTPVTQPAVGQKLTANIVCSDKEIGSYPVDSNAVYKWYYKESTDTVLGTSAVYTYTSDNVGKTVCVEVTVNGYEGKAVWEAAAPADLTWPENHPDVETVI